MSTQFHVLGPVEATVAGRAVYLGGRQQRRLLAVFVSELGRMVTVDRLAEIHFPDDPDSASSRASVRTYVSRLRSAIGDDRIVTRDQGYLLAAGPEETDAATFEVLLGEARTAAPPEAIALYDAALALWNGPAYGEFGSEWWALPEAARLEELRLVAHERRIDTVVALGDDGDAVADLERLILVNPLRERFVAQLMAALHRSGRQAEALRAYAQFRSRLIEASGIDPSPRVVELERAIAFGEAVSVDGRRHRGYEFGAMIGQGATGAVFRSRQPGVGRDVAVKTIRRELAGDPAFIRRFEAEAQRLARIEHPHVVPLYDFWRDATGAYLVFRFVKGGSIERSIVAGGSWPIDRADRLVHDIGGALIATHAAGIAHRDISTTNILQDETGNLYLSDFGISTGPDDRSFDQDVRTDVADLARVVVDVLVGGRSAVNSAVQDGHLRTPQDWASERLDQVPEALLGVLQRATRPPRSASERQPPVSPAGYNSVAEFLVDWRTALPRSAITTTQEIDPGIDAAHTLNERERQRVNPYKGLRAFRESDAAEFFGRDSAVDELADAIAEQTFVVLVGSSGSGKSSLVHAGLLPRLRARPDTYAVSLTPGTDPTKHLIEAIGELAIAGPDADGDGDSANAVSDEQIARRIRSAVERVPDGDLVIVVDQIEEIWTVCDDDARTDFLRHLTALVDQPADRVRVLVSLRADFFDRLLNEPLTGWRARASTIGVTPMTATELHDAIVQPAAQVGVTIEDRLVTRIVSELGSGTPGLPLLQFALSELYEHRSTTTIGESDYLAIGGIGGALARTAEALFESLDSAAQHDAAELFTRLVVVGEDHQALLRRRLRLGATRAIDASLIEDWVNARLLAFDHDPITREPMVEVAHEALFEQWPRLREWIHSERAWFQIRGGLTDAAAGWEQSQREPTELYHGSRLERALEMADKHPGSLTADERAFLDASVERRDAEANRTKRENRRLRRLVAAVGIVLAIALVAGAVAALQRRSAQNEAHRAETSRLMASAGSAAVTDTPVAALLALEARRRGDADEGQWATVAQRVLTAKPSFLGSFPTVGDYVLNEDASVMLARTAFGLEAYSTDDHTLLARVDHEIVGGLSGRGVAVSADGVVIETAGDDEIWRHQLPDLMRIGEPIRTPGNVRALAMSSTGVAASAHPDGLIVFWDPHTGQELRRLEIDGEVFRLDLADDGGRLAVATQDQTVVYRVSDLSPAGPPLVGTFVDVSISPDGARVAIPHLFVTDIFDVASGELMSSVMFGAGARWLDNDRLVVSTGLKLEVFDAATGNKQFEVITTCGCDLDVSSDGRTAVTGLDAPALYSLDGRQLLAEPIVATPESATGIDRLTVSPTHETIAVSQAFGGAIVYRRDGDSWTAVREFAAPASAIVVDDSQLLVTRGDVPVADVVDTVSGEVRWSVELDPNATFWVDVDSNRRWIAFQRFDGAVVVRDYRTGEVVAELSELVDLIEGNDMPFIDWSMGPSFSPDGSRLAASTWSGAAVGWRTDTWEATRLRYAGAYVNGASRPVFDPTGRYVAASAGRRAMSLFDATTFEPVKDLPLPVQGLPMSASFNADGSRLAVTLDTAFTVVLDVETGRQIGAPLRTNYLGALQFLSDGRLAASDSATDNVLVWNTDPDTMQNRLCAAAGRNLTRDEWSSFGPSGEPYRLTCPQFAEPPGDPTLSLDLLPT